MNKRFCALAAAIAFSVVGAAPALAGQSDTALLRGSCRPQPPLLVTLCNGTFAGVRANTDGSSFARFDMNTTGGLQFVMRVNRVVHSCSASSNMTELWKAAISGAGYFSVEFNPDGVCTMVLVGGGSNLKNDTAL
jgi:hypothetical protein